MSLNEKPLAKAHALFYKGLKAVGENESKINVAFRVAGLPWAFFFRLSKLGMAPVLAPFSVGIGPFWRSRGLKFRRGTVAGP